MKLSFDIQKIIIIIERLIYLFSISFVTGDVKRILINLEPWAKSTQENMNRYIYIQGNIELSLDHPQKALDCFIQAFSLTNFPKEKIDIALNLAVCAVRLNEENNARRYEQIAIKYFNNLPINEQDDLRGKLTYINKYIHGDILDLFHTKNIQIGFENKISLNSEFIKIIELLQNGEYIEVHNILNDIERRIKDLDIVESNIYFARLWLNRGWAFYNQRKLDEALSAFESSLSYWTFVDNSNEEIRDVQDYIEKINLELQ